MRLPSMRYAELAARERVVALRGHVLKGTKTACGIREFLHQLPRFCFIYRCRPRPAFTRASTPRWQCPLRCEVYGRACAGRRSSGWTGRFRAARNVRMAEVIIWTSPDFIRSRIAIWPFSVML